MSVPIYLVSSFCSSGTDGNPGAVCLLEPGSDDPEWMQAVAREMNASETSFVSRRSDGRFSIRWFSPRAEVPLCGHGTLASAHVLYDERVVGGDRIELVATGKELVAVRAAAGGIELDLPAIDCGEAPVPDWFERAVGAAPVRFLAGPGKYLAELASEVEVRGLNPDFRLLRQVADRGVIVTSRSDREPYDIVSRYFAAYVGVDEDPVTGSAHCCLGPYWAPRLGKSSFLAYQASPRGGRMSVRLAGNRVALTGAARTVLSGTLRL